MVTRRTLLKQGAYTTLSAAMVSILGGTARSQNTSSVGFDYYISPRGSDSNPGTLDKPWAITAINSRGREYAGKRVGLLDGTYNVYALCQADPKGQIALSINGGTSASAPTVIAAVNARKAVLTAADSASGALPSKPVAIIGQAAVVANKGNVILDGLSVTRAFGGGIWIAPLGWSGSDRATGVVVRNCDVYDIDGIVNYNLGGIKLHKCVGALISNNRIYGVQPNPGTAHPSNAAGIFSFNSHSNVYEYNTIYDCNTGIHDKNPDNGNHTYRYNYIEIAGLHPYTALQDCSGGGAGDVVTAHNNILVGPGIWDSSDMVMPSRQSLVFYNNTCYCHGGSAVMYLAAGSQVSPAAMVTFYNNMVYCTEVAGWAGAMKFCSGTMALFNYNVYRVDPGPRGIFALRPPTNLRPPGAFYTMSAWQKETGQDSNSTAIVAGSSSLFRAAARLDAGSYQLQPSAVGRGLGRIGGTASGAPTDVGAWGGGAKQIGCDFGPVPRSPVLTVE